MKNYKVLIVLLVMGFATDSRAAEWRKRKRNEMEAAREARNLQANVLMEDDAGIAERPAKRAKTEKDHMEDLVAALQGPQGSKDWKTRKELIQKYYAQRCFDLNALMYKVPLVTKQYFAHVAVDAALNADPEFMQWLLDRNVNPNCAGIHGSPLLFCVGDARVAQLLVSRGADVHAVDQSGEHLAMKTAFTSHDPDLIKLYGAQTRAPMSSGDAGGSPLTRLVDNVPCYPTKDLPVLLKKARLMVFGGVDLAACIAVGEDAGRDYQQLIVESIAAAKKERQRSSDKGHYDRRITKYTELGKAITMAIGEKREKELTIARELTTVGYQPGLAELMGQYAVEAD